MTSSCSDPLPPTLINHHHSTRPSPLLSDDVIYGRPLCFHRTILQMFLFDYLVPSSKKKASLSNILIRNLCSNFELLVPQSSRPFKAKYWPFSTFFGCKVKILCKWFPRSFAVFYDTDLSKCTLICTVRPRHIKLVDSKLQPIVTFFCLLSTLFQSDRVKMPCSTI